MSSDFVSQLCCRTFNIYSLSPSGLQGTPVPCISSISSRPASSGPRNFQGPLWSSLFVMMVLSVFLHHEEPVALSPFSFSLHSSSCSSMGSRLALLVCNVCLGLPCGSDGKASAYSAGDLGSIPGSGNSPGEGNGYPLQYSCLENPMDGGAR